MVHLRRCDWDGCGMARYHPSFLGWRTGETAGPGFNSGRPASENHVRVPLNKATRSSVDDRREWRVMGNQTDQPLWPD